MPKKYIIFDLDGTLIKSRDHLGHLVRDFLVEKYNIDGESFLYFLNQTQGMALREQLIKFVQLDDDEAHTTAQEIYELIRHSNQTHFFEGVPEVVKKLANDYTLFLSTGNSTPFAEEKLTEAGIIDIFEYVLGSETIFKGPEHIKIFEQQIGEELGENCIFVGDGQKDREIAAQHNMTFIHIDEQLKNTYNDTYEIACVTDIYSILETF